MGFLNQLRHGVRNALSRRWQVAMTVGRMSDVPERLARGSAVIVGRATAPKWLVFDCPCRLRHRVMLNLDLRRQPRWTVETFRPLTLRPSVDDDSYGTACHYRILAGKIRWVGRDAVTVTHRR